MCEVDFDWELGQALGGNKIYPSKENLMECRKCCAEEDDIHKPIETVTMSKEDFLELIKKAKINPSEIKDSYISENFIKSA